MGTKTQGVDAVVCPLFPNFPELYNRSAGAGVAPQDLTDDVNKNWCGGSGRKLYKQTCHTIQRQRRYLLPRVHELGKFIIAASIQLAESNGVRKPPHKKRYSTRAS